MKYFEKQAGLVDAKRQLMATIKRSGMGSKIRRSEVFKTLKSFDDVGKTYYPGLRALGVATAAAPIPGPNAAYLGLTAATIGANKISVRFPNAFKSFSDATRAISGG